MWQRGVEGERAPKEGEGRWRIEGRRPSSSREVREGEGLRKEAEGKDFGSGERVTSPFLRALLCVVCVLICVFFLSFLCVLVSGRTPLRRYRLVKKFEQVRRIHGKRQVPASSHLGQGVSLGCPRRCTAWSRPDLGAGQAQETVQTTKIGRIASQVSKFKVVVGSGQNG